QKYPDEDEVTPGRGYCIYDQKVYDVPAEEIEPVRPRYRRIFCKKRREYDYTQEQGHPEICPVADPPSLWISQEADGAETDEQLVPRDHIEGRDDRLRTKIFENEIPADHPE